MEPLLRNISDTALWAAAFRAQETARADAVFRDPLAERLAGPRGMGINDTVPHAGDHSWAWMTRTYLFDQVIREQVADGADMVINLAAGLDARPYRMALPPSLAWVEIDLPDLLAYKEELLTGENPNCSLERIAVDLANVEARGELLGRLAARSQRALVIAEGLLIYLTDAQVAALASELAAIPGFRKWVLDVCSPGLLQFLQGTMGQNTSKAGAPYLFGPAEGPRFFLPHGWEAEEVHSILQSAGRIGRVPKELEDAAKAPDSGGAGGDPFWSGVCLLKKLLPKGE